jgi:hypothetical protein
MYYVGDITSNSKSSIHYYRFTHWIQISCTQKLSHASNYRFMWASMLCKCIHFSAGSFSKGGSDSCVWCPVHSPQPFSKLRMHVVAGILKTEHSRSSLIPEFNLFISRAGSTLLKAVSPRNIYCRTSTNRWHLMCIFIFVNYDIVYNFENVFNFVTSISPHESSLTYHVRACVY